MSRIENHKFTIEQAFRECFYIVPDYQREYVWTEKQVKQLLEDIDISEQTEPDSSEYFIGIVLVSLSDNKTKRHFDVIDGQQRLTTIFLILCALRVFFRETEQGAVIDDLTITRYTEKPGEIKTKLKLEPRYENAYKVMQIIVKTNDVPEKVRKNIKGAGISIYGSVKKILTAYESIYKHLKDNYVDKDDKDELKKYWGHLSNNVMFIQISTDVSSALKIFETVNNRGVGLDSMDLLKNLLFTRVKHDEFSDLKEKWKNITKELERNKEKPLRFLRYFLIANYEIKDGAVIRENRIYDWISKQENAPLTGYQDKPFEFVAHIQQNVVCYIQFRQGHHIQFCEVGMEDGKESFALASLQMLTGKAFSLHYILLLAAANLPKSLFDQFVYQIESFLFYHILTKGTANELEPSFSMWASEVRRIAHIDNQVLQCKELNNFVREKFEPIIHDKRQAAEDALNRLTLDTLDRTRYLLARLTQHIDMAFRGQTERGSLNTYCELEIEHILPNTPNAALLSSWEKAHMEDEYPEQSYNEYKNRLGNLTLLEKPLNRSVGNKPHSEKKPIYAKSTHYLTQSLSEVKNVGQNTSITRINDYLCAPDEWDAKAIDERQKKLSKLALEVWKITEIK